jgi:hypothetical protein
MGKKGRAKGVIIGWKWNMEHGIGIGTEKWDMGMGIDMGNRPWQWKWKWATANGNETWNGKWDTANGINERRMMMKTRTEHNV